MKAMMCNYDKTKPPSGGAVRFEISVSVVSFYFAQYSEKLHVSSYISLVNKENYENSIFCFKYYFKNSFFRSGTIHVSPGNHHNTLISSFLL